MPAGVREYREIRIGNAVVEADLIDGVGGAIRVEFEGVVRTAAKVANEPGEGSKIDNARRDTSFCKFANSKEDVGTCVVGKVEEGAHSRAKREALLFLCDECNVRSGNWAIVLAEDIIRGEGSIAFWEFGVWIVALKSVQDITMLIQSIARVLVLVDAHLEEPVRRSEEFDIEAVVDGIFKLFFDGIVASSVEHVVDEK